MVGEGAEVLGLSLSGHVIYELRARSETSSEQADVLFLGSLKRPELVLGFGRSLQPRARKPELAERGAIDDAGRAFARQLEPARATRRIGRDDFLSMLGGDDPLEEAFGFAQSHTDAIVGTHVCASLDRRDPAACALAARHYLDVSSHFNDPGHQLEVRSCLPSSHALAPEIRPLSIVFEQAEPLLM